MKAPRERVWEALLTADMGSSPWSKALLAMRGYRLRAFGARGGTFPERLERFGFTRLEEIPGRELVFGIAGRFWRPDGALVRIADREAFLVFAEDGRVKAAWNVRVEDADAGHCELSTETRIQYFGAAARRRFRLYWAVVGPFSGILRRSLLRGIRRRAETPTADRMSS